MRNVEVDNVIWHSGRTNELRIKCYSGNLLHKYYITEINVRINAFVINFTRNINV